MTVTKLIEYNNDGSEDTEIVWEELTDICESLIKKYGKLVKWGFFGAWYGARFGGSFIEDMTNLRGHICQDFSEDIAFELSFTDEDITVAPFQRYCASTELIVPKNSLILKQWHHDGCCVYYLRGYVFGDHPKTAETADIELEGY